VCVQDEESTEVLIIIDGILDGVTDVEPPSTGSWATDPAQDAGVGGVMKQRRISTGDTVNVLCALKVWERCIETVVADVKAEAYAVNADEFYGLFNHDNEIDEATFEDLRITELRNFKMDTNYPWAPTLYGVPLYMSFSCIHVSVLEARGILARDYNLLSEHTSDPYATIEIVDYDTRKVLSSRWFHRCPTQRKTLKPEWTEGNDHRWRDIHLPFEKLGLKITIFDEDVLSRTDDELGEVFIRVSDLNVESGDCPFVKDAAQARWKGMKSKGTIETIMNIGGKKAKKKLGWGAAVSKVKRRSRRIQPLGEKELGHPVPHVEKNVLTMWHELQPTKKMLKEAKESGEAIHSLGLVKIQTYVKSSEGLRDDKNPDADDDDISLSGGSF